MLHDTLGDFEDYFSNITNIDLEHFEATLASKEEIFGDEKSFPYFKALFKEGREKYIKEFGKYSTFWLRTVYFRIRTAPPYFDLIDNIGEFYYNDASASRGFRPLIILED